MTQINRNQTRATQHGKKGFAAMPKEKVKEIASKGGKSSHGSSYGSQAESTGNRGHSSGKQGFASMPKEKVKEIASKGGKSHGKSR